MAEIDWLNRLAKWRTVLAGWQLGTRPKGDPESDAVRDHREATLLLRAEVSALAALLIRKGIITAQELTEQSHGEAKHLCEAYARSFPGFEATDYGIQMDPARARETTKGWKP